MDNKNQATFQREGGVHKVSAADNKKNLENLKNKNSESSGDKPEESKGSGKGGK